MAAPLNWNVVFSMLRRLYPDSKVPDSVPGAVDDISTVKTRARRVELLKAFGQDDFVSLEDSVKANAEVFV